MPPKKFYKRKFDSSAKTGGKTGSASAETTAGAPQGPQIQYDLGTEKKKVTVRKFKNMKLVDIREYYQKEKEGAWLPGSKGISLTQEQWSALVSRMIDIGEALIKIDDREEFENMKELLEKKQKVLAAASANVLNSTSDASVNPSSAETEKTHPDEEEEDLDDVEFEDVSEEPAAKKPKME